MTTRRAAVRVTFVVGGHDPAPMDCEQCGYQYLDHDGNWIELDVESRGHHTSTRLCGRCAREIAVQLVRVNELMDEAEKQR